MVQRKISQLSEDDSQLLVAASVQGYDFDSAVIATRTGRDPADVEERLVDLERIYTFVHRRDEHEFPDGTLTTRYRFVHVLYQNVLYGSLSVSRRVQLSKAVGETILEVSERMLPVHSRPSSDFCSKLRAIPKEPVCSSPLLRATPRKFSQTRKQRCSRDADLRCSRKSRKARSDSAVSSRFRPCSERASPQRRDTLRQMCSSRWRVRACSRKSSDSSRSSRR